MYPVDQKSVHFVLFLQGSMVYIKCEYKQPYKLIVGFGKSSVYFVKFPYRTLNSQLQTFCVVKVPVTTAVPRGTIEDTLCNSGT